MWPVPICSSAELARCNNIPSQSGYIARSSSYLRSDDIKVEQVSVDEGADLRVEHAASDSRPMRLLIAVLSSFLFWLPLHFTMQLEDVDEEVQILWPCSLIEELLLLLIHT